MATTFRRLLGHESALDPGQYTVESGWPVLRCCSCGLTAGLPDGYTWDSDGRVNYKLACRQVGCGFEEWIVLDAIRGMA